jgi:hypothetical protein
LAVRGQPTPTREVQPALESGALTVLLLFLGTIVVTVSVRNFFELRFFRPRQWPPLCP